MAMTYKEYVDSSSELDVSRDESFRIHCEYYGQFVTEGMMNFVKNHIGMERLLKSTNEHLNDIPLVIWDKIAIFHLPSGHPSTRSTRVCLVKEAGRKIIENYLQ